MSTRNNQSPLKQPFQNTQPPQLSDVDSGMLEYVRIAEQIENPGSDLANKTIKVAKGGTVDVLASKDSSMGPERVAYTPGLKAFRKVVGQIITYRFSVPPDAPRGARYMVRALGSKQAAPFVFTVQVS